MRGVTVTESNHGSLIKQESVFCAFGLKDQMAKIQRPLFRGMIGELKAQLWKTHCALLWWHLQHY